MKIADLIAQLQTQAQSELDKHIRPGQRVAVLDFPYHANAGDSYIWLGEIAYLKRRGADIVYVCWDQAYDPERVKRAVGPDGIVLYHGGGNFGDRWSEPHKLRLRVLRDFKGHKLLQFPQTVHFDHAENIAETARLIEEHGDFVLLARDHVSYQFAKTHFNCTVGLSPDMAFFIGAKAAAGAVCDGLVLARTDIESAGAKAVKNLPLERLPGRWRRDDWLVPDWFEVKLANQFHKLNAPLNRWTWGGRLMASLATAVAATRLRRGIRQLSQGRVILTDRLHVHILCLLLNKEHVVLDNDYGKISTFHQAWTKPSELTTFVDSFDEAVATLAARAPARSL
ncbi:polysaccharide pyruvyl transferase family protein [Rugamonas sp. DEMB1]|uniref:polysaccharide pyruvyl transferase family protein n=1 Tax=Rugamonas sp. DEMB1 TaxID=3039386 RepID=UPI0024486488|nr:polysaccharide pyruvyl transferase family protein [Rugamonas sp. DEMB1]WGG49134.1 polysaccharide pyruvyl transferase family protein [Rugamonas sp. DEMB1]